MPGTSLTQKTALLPVQTRPPPNVAPGPLCNEFLSWPRIRAGALQRVVDVLVAEYGPAHLQPLLKELVVQVLSFRVRRHDVLYAEV